MCLDVAARGFGMRVVGGKTGSDGRLFAYIVWTVPGGPAEKGGLQQGDKVNILAVYCCVFGLGSLCTGAHRQICAERHVINKISASKKMEQKFHLNLHAFKSKRNSNKKFRSPSFCTITTFCSYLILYKIILLFCQSICSIYK